MVGNATVSVTGAAGVAPEWNNAGKGDEVSGDLTLTYNEPFLVCVDFGGGSGGAGLTDNPAWPSPDGGGASSIATNSSTVTNTLLLVGGGGGGATIDTFDSGGNAGDPNGSPTVESTCLLNVACGLGGTASAVGQGGASFTPPGEVATKAGSPGFAHTATQPGSGGNGGNAVDGEYNTIGGGGGGAGYYGGGGGAGGEEPDSGNLPGGIGGGGSDYCASTVSNCSVTSGAGTQHDVNSGAGEPEVVITMNQTPTSLSISAPTSQTYGSTIAPTSIAASLSSGNSPTGSIDFYYVVQSSATAPSSCEGATLGSSVSVSGNGTYNPSTSFDVSQPGFVFWYATYSGDGANSGSTTSCGTSDTQIKPADQSISYTSPSSSSSLVVGSTYEPSPTGGASGNSVQISIDSSTTNECSTDGTTVYLNHVGSCQVDFSQPGGTGEYNATSTNVLFDIAQAPQAVTVSSPTNPTVNGNYTPTVTGGKSGNSVALSVDNSTTNDACSVSGVVVDFEHAGSCVLDANQGGNDDYLEGYTSINILVVRAPQTVTISSPTNPTVNGSYTPTVTGGGSGSSVNVSVDIGTTNNACSVSGGVVDFDHAGYCVLDANEGGNGDYNSGFDSINFTIVKASQTVTISSPTNPTVNGSYTPTVTGGGSGSSVNVSVDIGTTNNACSVSGGVVTFDHAGYCVLDANEGGNGDYNSGFDSINFTIVKASQSVTISTPMNPIVNGSYTPTVTGGKSGSSVSLSVDIGTTNNACSVSGGVVTFANAGSCVLDANQGGSGDYNSGSDSINFLVLRAPQTVTIATPTNPTVNGNYTPTVTGGGSGNPIVLSVDARTPSDACTTDGTVVTFAHAGSCVLDANQDGSDDYLGGITSINFNVAQAPQTVNIATPTNPTVNGSYTPTVTGGGSNNAVVLSVDNSTTNDACSVIGVVVDFEHAGSCVLDANQDGSGDYLAGYASINFNVARATSSFSITSPTSPTVNGSYTPTITGRGSGEHIVLSVDASTTNNACLVNGTVVTFAHGGTCVLDANQDGNADYNPDSQSINFLVVPAAQSVTIATPTNPTVNGNYTPTVTGGGSGNPIVLSVDASTTNDACTTDGTVVTFAHAGSCVLDANQDGNGDYNAGTASIHFDVASPPGGGGGGSPSSLVFTSTPPSSAVVGGTYDPTATGGTPGVPITFQIDPGTTNGACSIAGSVVTLHNAGTCVLDAEQSSTATSAASIVSQSFSVVPGVGLALLIGTTTVLHVSPFQIAHGSSTEVRLEVVVRSARGKLVARGAVTIPGVRRVAIVNGRATLNLEVAELSVGPHSWYAVFGGYGLYAKSTSHRVKLVVT
jgi:hypothetical protein